MAWNRPSGSDNPGRVKRTAKTASLKRLLVFGILVACAAAAWILLSSNDEKRPECRGTHTQGRIREVAPAVTNRTPVAETNAAVAKPPVEETVYGHRKVRVDEKGNRWIMQGGRERLLKRLNPGMVKPIFHNRAENQISAVLTCRPGDPIIGWKMDDSFVDSFLESLKVPIIISKDDPPDVADEKRLVREAKIELKRRYDAGEDIVQIMRDEYKNIAKNYNLRKDLVNELARMREEGATAKELDVFVESANILMRSYGQENPLRLMKHERAQLTAESAPKKESEK